VNLFFHISQFLLRFVLYLILHILCIPEWGGCARSTIDIQNLLKISKMTQLLSHLATAIEERVAEHGRPIFVAK